jgi:acyl-CoA synthetase (AMP-forming)/AMP-acid ligase II
MSFDAIASDDSWRSEFSLNWLKERRSGPDEASHVMVSSGTTGLPKCSLFSDNNTIVKILRQYVQAAKVTSEDVAAALAPAGTGSTGYNYPILAMLLVGGTAVLLDHWSGRHVKDVLDLLRRHACTTAVVVPAQLARLVQVAEFGSTEPPVLRVITSSGAKLPPSVVLAAERVFGCKVQGVYGSSEAGAAAMTRIDDPDMKRRDTVGRPLEGQVVQIRDADATALPIGEVGEICWRGANKSYGFLNDAEATASVWDAEGWLHSGDLGKLDDDGYLHIVGRLKDMIIRGGQNVNPGAIEEALLSHPAVSEVAIVPFDDAVLGERIGACVVARGNASLSLESLKAVVLDKGMAAWNQPELLVLLDELPRNAGGKIDKKALKAVASAAASHKE